MIVQITGKCLSIKPPLITIACASGLAYEVLVSMNTLYQLGEARDVTLLTHFIVREDTQQLYGFYAQDERALFQSLIKVNGIGPKSAISILSSISVNDFIVCVQKQDTAALVKLPGIGKKTAERLVIEMRDKLAEGLSEAIFPNTQTSQLNLMGEPRRVCVNDAVSALVSLGYKPAEATRAVSLVDDEHKDTQTLIRDALKSIGQSSVRGAA